MQIGLYIASVVGALALLLIMPKKSFTLPKLGALLGAAAIGGAWLFVARQAPQWLENTGLPGGALPYYYIFSALAILSAVRVITHTKPVYAALWFVMVVLASAGLFLTLSADFIALAMVIIYGGAILVTYVFVIMLAAHSATDESDETPEYERIARAPVGAVAAGFVLLATLLTVAFDASLVANPAAAAPTDEVILNGVGGGADQKAHQTRLLVQDERAVGRALRQVDEANRDAVAADLDARSLSNAERVGLDLFQGNPLGLELAGVILLVSLIGAVIIARKVVDEEQEARG
jgi:NADH-quinone oxidoreductase subunit J